MPHPRGPLPDSLVGRTFRTTQGLAAGASAQRLRAGDLAAPFHGIRGTPGLSTDTVSHLLGYRPRLRPGQFFSHASAALLWQLPLPRRLEEEAAVHVGAFRPASPPRTRGVVGHALYPERTVLSSVRGVPVTDLLDTWCLLAAALTVDELVAAGDAVLQRSRTPPRSIEELSTRVAAHRWIGRERLRRAIPLIRPGSESPRETALRLLLVRAGLPEPHLNVEVRDPRTSQFIARVDMAFPTHHVAVEYEGEHHRTDRRQFARDIARYEALERAGWRHVRVTAEHLADDARDIIARVTTLFEARSRIRESSDVGSSG